MILIRQLETTSMEKELLLLILLALFVQCKKKEEAGLLAPHKKFIDNVVGNKDSFYGFAKNGDPEQKKELAIGVFDSGIGGLTVFDAIANADFHNAAQNDQPDGIRDFEQEQFIYLADQANMPYSNYVEEGNKDLLVEHILKDALFLLNHNYHVSAFSPDITNDKPTVKAIVIACNTATAYGKPQVEELCELSGSGCKVIGVIDAGCKGALEIAGNDKNTTIAILATPATVGSMAYVNTLNELQKGCPGNVNVIQQGGKGLHESIDNKPEFISSKYTRPYAEYQGPSLYHVQYRIQKELLDYYHFDTTSHHMLYNKDNLESSDTIGINSVENYVRYHVVSLAEQLKEKKDTVPLKAIILGCTHYPYVSATISAVLRELKKTERYDHLLADSVFLIDPAINTAKELYGYLSEQDLFNNPGQNRIKESRFFLTVPNSFEPEVEQNPGGGFTYEYQYRKRKVNQLKDFTLIVPFSKELISDEQTDIIRNRLPFTYDLLKLNTDRLGPVSQKNTFPNRREYTKDNKRDEPQGKPCSRVPHQGAGN